MTDSRTPSTGDLLDRGEGEDALARAAARLDGALARLEAGFSSLSAKAARPSGGDRAREAALESALREASGTLGEMIAEVREAIQAAEAEAEAQGRERADG